MTTIRAMIVWAIAVAAAVPALASPYCVDLEGFPLQCLYVDAGQCGDEAARLGGRCTANPQEIKTPPGPGNSAWSRRSVRSPASTPTARVAMTTALECGAACIPATPQPNPKLTPGHDPFAI